jgi:tetratricopeptide (TPR) repeat protein
MRSYARKCGIAMIVTAFVVCAISFVSAQQTYPQMDEGLPLEKEGKLEEALGIYRKVASEMPKFADVYARMAYTLRKMEYAKQSSEMLDKCQKSGGFEQDSPYAMDAHFLGGWFLTDAMAVPAISDEGELLKTESAAKALMYSSKDVWVLMMTRQGHGVPIINNTPTVGVGSELRFDRGDWVAFLGKQYRKGGVRVLKTGLEFLEGTEQLDNGAVKVLRSGKWMKQ